MKSLLCALLLFYAGTAYSNGVGVVDAAKGTYFTLDSTNSIAHVEDQVAIVTTTQSYHNQTGSSTTISFAYPLPASASAIKLRWNSGSGWKEAVVSKQAQDTTLPGTGSAGSIASNLRQYLGASPLLFAIPDIISSGGSLTVELTYVQLLTYELGIVQFSMPNNYSLIQPGIVLHQRFEFTLDSKRTIDTASLQSHEASYSSISGNTADLVYEMGESKADQDYSVTYRLNSTQLGLYGYSTFLDSALDAHGRGHMLFIAEPDASEDAAAIAKTFVLVIDRSGSMSGTKIQQARDAASFIVRNLNEGDNFNIIDFDDVNESFKSAPVPYTIQNQTDALAWISRITARNGTNIASALVAGVNQFPPFDSSKASIIIFLTDGQATSGTTSTSGILDAIANAQAGKQVTIFPFGIGSDVNKQLLALIASKNDGIADYLLANELNSAISKFYLKVRNPVLLNPTVTFDPAVITDVHPDVLPNLYKGVQLLVSGRYAEAVHPLRIILAANAFGKHTEYHYTLDLADSMPANEQFLPKVWAKMDIDDLLADYNTLDANSAAGKQLKDSISNVSVRYGIVTEFTSFQQSNNSAEVSASGADVSEISAHVYPNPFHTEATIRFQLPAHGPARANVKIYAMTGELVRSLSANTSANGDYSLIWDGTSDDGSIVSDGTYICWIEIENTVYSIKIVKQS